MGPQRARNCTRQRYRNRVADHAPYALEEDRTVLACERVVVREGLEDRTFTKRNRPILLRMTEATVAEPVKTAS